MHELLIRTAFTDFQQLYNARDDVSRLNVKTLVHGRCELSLTLYECCLFEVIQGENLEMRRECNVYRIIRTLRTMSKFDSYVYVMDNLHTYNEERFREAI